MTIAGNPEIDSTVLVLVRECAPEFSMYKMWLAITKTPTMRLGHSETFAVVRLKRQAIISEIHNVDDDSGRLQALS